MSSTPVTPAPKESWLKKVGQFFGKVLKVVATDSQPIERIAAPIAEALLPQFAPAIVAADGIFNKIVAEAVAAEVVVSGTSAISGGGVQKLEYVLNNISPVIDGWVKANFPGAAQVSTAAKSGLVNGVVAILNEIDPSAVSKV